MPFWSRKSAPAHDEPVSSIDAGSGANLLDNITEDPLQSQSDNRPPSSGGSKRKREDAWISSQTALNPLVTNGSPDVELGGARAKGNARRILIKEPPAQHHHPSSFVRAHQSILSPNPSAFDQNRLYLRHKLRSDPILPVLLQQRSGIAIEDVPPTALESIVNPNPYLTDHLRRTGQPLRIPVFSPSFKSTLRPVPPSVLPALTFGIPNTPITAPPLNTVRSPYVQQPADVAERKRVQETTVARLSRPRVILVKAQLEQYGVDSATSGEPGLKLSLKRRTKKKRSKPHELRYTLTSFSPLSATESQAWRAPAVTKPLRPNRPRKPKSVMHVKLNAAPSPVVGKDTAGGQTQAVELERAAGPPAPNPPNEEANLPMVENSGDRRRSRLSRKSSVTTAPPSENVTAHDVPPPETSTSIPNVLESTHSRTRKASKPPNTATLPDRDRSVKAEEESIPSGEVTSTTMKDEAVPAVPRPSKNALQGRKEDGSSYSSQPAPKVKLKGKSKSRKIPREGNGVAAPLEQNHTDQVENDVSIGPKSSGSSTSTKEVAGAVVAEGARSSPESRPPKRLAEKRLEKVGIEENKSDMPHSNIPSRGKLKIKR
ncbi:hypothetical protein HDU93_004920 [Gonapodya sp. JEL0774]|nr:hypothetical protein HDU93_004920 [Gonapodya sp. JEL0774]